jgi:hypothetical protein
MDKIIVKATIRCSYCGATSLVKMDNVPLIVVPCKGCSRYSLFGAKQAVTLDEEELLEVLQGQDLVKCGDVLTTFLGDRYKDRESPLDPDAIEAEITKLIEGEEEDGRDHSDG